MVTYPQTVEGGIDNGFELFVEFFAVVPIIRSAQPADHTIGPLVRQGVGIHNQSLVATAQTHAEAAAPRIHHIFKLGPLLRIARSDIAVGAETHFLDTVLAARYQAPLGIEDQNPAAKGRRHAIIVIFRHWNPKHFLVML